MQKKYRVEPRNWMVKESGGGKKHWGGPRVGTTISISVGEGLIALKNGLGEHQSKRKKATGVAN